MEYKNLNLTVDETLIDLPINQTTTIHIKKYLPISDKIDLIQIALQKAEENGIYNEMKLMVHFYLNLIYLYTDLEFTPEDREDEYKLYDELDSNGLIEAVCNVMDDDEYNELLEDLDTMKEDLMKHKGSAAALLQTVTQDLPRNAAAAADILEKFNKENYPEVVKFAQAANGNRPIPTLVEE